MYEWKISDMYVCVCVCLAFRFRASQAFKTPHGPKAPCLGQPGPLTFKYFLSTLWKHTVKWSISSLVLVYAIQSFDELYVSVTLRQGKDPYTKGIGTCLFLSINSLIIYHHSQKITNY